MSFRLEEKIGEGSYGYVYKATYLSDEDRKYAVKVYKDTGYFNNFCWCDFRLEIDLLSRISHPNVIKLHQIFISNQSSVRNVLNSAFELAETNLEIFIRTKTLSQGIKVSLMEQFLTAMKFIHDCGYYHLDIKPENILISDNILKIADMGRAKSINSLDEHIYDMFINCIAYRAPEFSTKETSFRKFMGKGIVIKRPAIDHISIKRAEFFAIGRVLLDIYTNDSSCNISRYSRILETLLLPFSEKVNIFYRDGNEYNISLAILIGLMTNFFPDQRLTDFDTIFTFFDRERNQTTEGSLSLQLPYHNYFNNIAQFDAIKKAISLCNRISINIYDLGNIIALYYRLVSYGLINLSELPLENRFYLIMAASMILALFPNDVYVPRNYSAIVKDFVGQSGESSLSVFIEKAYIYLKGVVIYDNITNYSRRYGHISAWLSLRYYLDEYSIKKSFNSYLDEICLTTDYTHQSSIINQLPRDIYLRLF